MAGETPPIDGGGTPEDGAVDSGVADSDAVESGVADSGAVNSGVADTDAVGSGATDSGAAGGESLPFGVPAWLGALLPIVLLAMLVGGLVLFPPFADLGGEPLPDVSITHSTIPDGETVVLHVTNDGSDPVTIQQVLVNDAYWDFTVGDGGEGARTLAPMESAPVRIPYHWNPGWDVHTALVIDGGATVSHTIVAPQQTPGVSSSLLGTLALVGLFVGVIPVLLGMAWYPFMQNLSDRWLHAVLALAGGVLAFLAIDAGFESLEVAEAMPGAYDGPILVVLAAVGTLLLVQAIASHWRDHGRLSPLGLAYLVALSIGLHNLAEGLAIGGAVALGRVSLGAFLVIGFMVHNVTEGPAVVAPVAREERPSLWHFVGLGVLAGAPVILGGWIGSLALDPTLGGVFLAVGVGAIVQVLWEIGSMIRRDGTLVSTTNLLAALAGLVVMYLTDLFVAV